MQRPRARAHGFRTAPLPVPEAVAAATWEAPGGAMPEGATPLFLACESLARTVTLTQSSLSTVTGQQRARPGHGHEYPNTRYRHQRRWSSGARAPAGTLRLIQDSQSCSEVKAIEIVQAVAK